VRSKKGLAYSVYGSVGSGFFEPGMFRAGLQTKSSTAIKGIQAIKTEIDEIISKPATDDELKRAKDAILNSFVFHYDSKGKILGQQMTYAFYGLPEDFLDQYRANIEKVTIADVSRVAKKYVHPDQLAVLVVGKAADFDQPLQVLGKVTTVDITIPAPPDTAPKAEKSAATIAAGKEIWSRVIKALGGDALKKTDAFRVKGSVALKMGGQSMALKQETTIVFPDKIRQSVITPIGTQTVVLDGEVGFMMAGDKVQSLPAEMVQDQVQEMRRGLENLLRYNDDPGLEIVAAGEEKVDGADCKILSASYKGTQSRIWVGADGKVVKQSYAGKNPFTRAPGTVEVAWSDYRPEGPLLVAHKQVQSMDGKEIMSTTVDEFEINPKVDPDQFKKPAGQ
jgi:zinc protease